MLDKSTQRRSNRARRRHLPRDYSRQLPRLVGDALAGVPRVYAVALDLISHQDGRVDGDNSAAFIAAYQSVAPLDLGELWAFPIMLRLALLENIRRVGARIAHRREERDVAIAWADRMVTVAEKAPRGPHPRLPSFADARRTLTAPLLGFRRRLQAQGPAVAFVQSWLENRLPRRE